MYREYQLNGLKDIDLSFHDQNDPQIKRLINDIRLIQEKKMNFEDMSKEDIEKLAQIIYRE